MEKLIQIFLDKLKSVDISFKRYLWNEIDWNNRLIAIIGARGVGKTTMLLQYIKTQFTHRLSDVIYANLDNLYFTRTSLTDFADEFVKRGGKYLFLDEVHKYPDWSVAIKNIYDDHPGLSIVFTGSSALDIFKGKADLSRRILVYKMNGLSFREFVELKYKHAFPVLSLQDIISPKASVFCNDINEVIKPVKLFEEYVKTGYYPFFREDEKNYTQRLMQTVDQILENDLPAVARIDYSAIYKLRQLFSIIAEIAPFKPNILELSRQIGIDRDTLVKYLYLLSKADLLMLLQKDTGGINRLNKPEKVYLNNPNLMLAITSNAINIGTLRETFFYNQLKVKHIVNYADKGDFLIDKLLLFEVGGKNKTQKQIAGIENAFIAADNIEYAYKNTIPIWLFGFLY
jgi:hypothetical protein